MGQLAFGQISENAKEKELVAKTIQNYIESCDLFGNRGKQYYTGTRGDNGFGRFSAKEDKTQLLVSLLHSLVTMLIFKNGAQK